MRTILAKLLGGFAFVESLKIAVVAARWSPASLDRDQLRPSSRQNRPDRCEDRPVQGYCT